MATYQTDPEIRQGEMRSLLATLTGMPAEQIGGWVVVVRAACGKTDCIGLGCEDGPLALLSAGSSLERPPGDGEPYILHMLGTAIDEIATAMRDRGER